MHLQRLKERGLVKVHAEGRHRYYSLENSNVAAALEALSVLAGGRRGAFAPTTPGRLRAARTCYDHVAGVLGVSIHDRFLARRWLSTAVDRADGYDLTPAGAAVLTPLGVDVEARRASRRRFGYACLDWSERTPHIGGALGAALLTLALKRRWLTQDADSRALHVTPSGRRELHARLGVDVASE